MRTTPREEETEGFIIESVTEAGKRFRPSDWIERLSSVLGSFGPDRRLRYSADVFPSVINGEKCLVVSHGLARTNPGAFEYVLQFARDNQLRIRKDRRNQPAIEMTERCA